MACILHITQVTSKQNVKWMSSVYHQDRLKCTYMDPSPKEHGFLRAKFTFRKNIHQLTLGVSTSAFHLNTLKTSKWATSAIKVFCHCSDFVAHHCNSIQYRIYHHRILALIASIKIAWTSDLLEIKLCTLCMSVLCLCTPDCHTVTSAVVQVQSFIVS